MKYKSLTDSRMSPPPTCLLVGADELKVMDQCVITIPDGDKSKSTIQSLDHLWQTVRSKMAAAALEKLTPEARGGGFKEGLKVVSEKRVGRFIVADRNIQVC